MAVANRGGAKNWANYPRWTTVSSSTVLAIRYEKHVDPKTGELKEDGMLEVQFQGMAKGIKTPIYRYKPVPMRIAIAFYQAPSQGKFVRRYLMRYCNVTGPF